MELLFTSSHVVVCSFVFCWFFFNSQNFCFLMDEIWWNSHLFPPSHGTQWKFCHLINFSFTFLMKKLTIYRDLIQRAAEVLKLFLILNLKLFVELNYPRRRKSFRHRMKREKAKLSHQIKKWKNTTEKFPRDSNPDAFTLMVLFALISLFYVFCIFSEASHSHIFCRSFFFCYFLCAFTVPLCVCFTSFLCRH